MTTEWALSRFDRSRLLADLAIWPAMLVAVFLASEWVLHRYRPRLRWRVTTLIVVMIVSAFTLLANLSYDLSHPAGGWSVYSYGWPVIWCRHMQYTSPLATVVNKWDYGGCALAGNLATWLAVLAVTAVVSERFIHRYQLRFRFSVRTMLVGVVFTGALCAWFVAARNRAEEQDTIIALIGVREDVCFERFGPGWLDVVGADRFRRRLVAARMFYNDYTCEELLARLARTPSLQFLDIVPDVYRKPLVFTPRMAATLADMRQLRMLNVDCQGWGRADSPIATHRCLAAVAHITQLERLRLGIWREDTGELANLSSLPNLKTLALDIQAFEYRDDQDLLERRANGVPRVLDRVHALPRLKELDLHGSCVGDADLDGLARFAGLKSLDLSWTSVSDAGLAKLAALGSLEELAIDDCMATATAFDAMVGLKQLRKVHIDTAPGKGDLSASVALDDGQTLRSMSPAELNRTRRALQRLREAHPGIVIDGNYASFAGRVHLEPPWGVLFAEEEMDAFLGQRLHER